MLVQRPAHLNCFLLVRCRAQCWVDAVLKKLADGHWPAVSALHTAP